jgi:hypothetical protein
MVHTYRRYGIPRSRPDEDAGTADDSIWRVCHPRKRLDVWLLGPGSDQEAMSDQEGHTASAGEDVEQGPGQVRMALGEGPMSVQRDHRSRRIRV